MFKLTWDVKEPTHYSKRVGREVPGVVAVLCVVNTGPMLIVVSITAMVILYKYVKIIIIIISGLLIMAKLVTTNFVSSYFFLIELLPVREILTPFLSFL